MSRLLIDLTDLELWSGHHGGTQRVVYGITKQFFLTGDSPDEIVYIAFSDKDKAFHQTSFAPIYERVEAANQTPDPVIVSAGLSRKARLKYKLRPYIPEQIRKSPAARKVAVQTLNVAVKAASKSRTLARRQQQTVAVTGQPVIVFQADDTVLMLGKPWDNLDIQRTLTRQKDKTGFKLVQLVYDMIIPLYPHLHHPSLFATYTQHMFEAVAASDVMLPISESSATDLKRFCELLALPVPEIKVIRLGDELLVDTAVATKPDNRIHKNFIACVGTIEIRKNHMLLYYTYKLAQQKGIELPQLIIVGGGGWLTDDFRYLVQHDNSLSDKILLLSNISDAGLSWIYQNCAFTVYPSMYEGWGLPVAESLAYGKPCISSNISSMPEIAGDLIDYFSPYDSADCLTAINKYLDNTILKRKVAKVMSHYKQTTWQQTYKQVVAACRLRHG